MRLELIAILQAVIVTAGIHGVSPDRRIQIIALVGATGGQLCNTSCYLSLATLSHLLALYVDSCSQWTAFE
jgi:hypothetical protein